MEAFESSNYYANSSKSIYISRLILNNFRNYDSLRLDVNNIPIIITGHNGAGKTNILEAISFLTPGRGLRSIKLSEADKLDNNSLAGWGVSALVSSGNEEIQIGTIRDSSFDGNKRTTKIDGEIIKNQAQLATALSVMWLTPQMDGLFISNGTDRRKFLDRLVYNFDPEHASRVYSYDYSVKERNKLLTTRPDPGWLSVVEAKISEKAVSIAAARLDAIDIIQRSIFQAPTAFPKALIQIDGGVEEIVTKMPALQAEEELKQKLLENRYHDGRIGRTSVGTHKSDLKVTHMDKNMPAESCSTGEQKALLLSIILAEARAKAMWKNSVPILLLDEVIAHLDDKRRKALFEEIIAMRAQTWLTGTDPQLFNELKGVGKFLKVEQNTLIHA